MSLLLIVCPHCNDINRVPSECLTQKTPCDACKQVLFAQRPSKLTARNFQFYLSNNDIPVVVHFWSPSSEVNQAMEAAYTLATTRLEPWVRLARLNVEQEKTMAIRYQINSTPTLIFFKSDREIARTSGVMTASEIMSWISSYI